MIALPGRLLLLGGAAALAALALAVLAAAGLPLRADYSGAAPPGQAQTAPEINACAPQFDLPRADGTRLRLADAAGAPVIINFWATWCAPCRAEMPALQRFYEAHQGAGLRVLAINTGESAAAVRAWRAEFGLTFDLLLDERQQTAASYRLRGQPSTYIVAPDGRIAHIFYGPVFENDLAAALAPYLPQPESAP